MTPPTPWERISKVYELSGCDSVSEFARSLGLNRAENLFQIKRGNNGISLRLAEKINTKYRKFSIAWLVTGEGKPFVDGAWPDFRTIPLYVDFSTNSIGKPSDGVIPVSHGFFYDADCATIIKNDWLEPKISAGSLIILKSSRRIIYGGYYYIELENGDSFYRIIRKSKIGGFIRLASNNSSYDAIEILEKEITAHYVIVGVVNNI